MVSDRYGVTMGNREELIAGAKRCLIEKGFARTTARDIASASGVSLAAIGYHFGTKDALMMQALYELIGEWGEELEHALTENAAPARDPARRFESIWDRTIESFGGSALHALLIGMMVKWFMDPKQAPSGPELAQGIRLIADRMAAGHAET